MSGGAQTAPPQESDTPEEAALRAEWLGLHARLARLRRRETILCCLLLLPPLGLFLAGAALDRFDLSGPGFLGFCLSLPLIWAVRAWARRRTRAPQARMDEILRRLHPVEAAASEGRRGRV